MKAKRRNGPCSQYNCSLFICYLFLLLLLLPQYRQLQALSPRQCSIFHHIMLYHSYYTHLPPDFSPWLFSWAWQSFQPLGCKCDPSRSVSVVGDGSISPPVNLWAGPPVKQLVRLLWNVIWSTGDVLNIIFANSTTWCDKIWKIVLDINAAHLAACVVIDNRAVWCNCQVHFSSLWQPLTRFLS